MSHLPLNLLSFNPTDDSVSFANVKTISLKEVLATMSTGAPFDVTFIKADVSRKTGGQVRHWKNCRIQGMNYEHSIRRIVREDGQVRNVRIWLITEFNQKRVLL